MAEGTATIMWKLLLDDKGAAVLRNGKPVYVNDKGQELELDYEATVQTITRLNGEAKSHREAKEAAEAKAKAFEGIEDAESARKALETVKNLGAGELKTAAQVQEIKDAAAKSAQEAVAAATRAAAEKERALSEVNAKLESDLNRHIVGSAFANSKFIAEKSAIPADVAQKVFGDRLRVENGKAIGLDEKGNPMFSGIKHGELADTEEVIQALFAQHPHSATLLKGSGASGGGANGGMRDAGGKKTMPRSQFESLDPAARQAALKDTTITD
jgi:hypothetical protein